MNYSNDSHPVCGVYSLDNLISINSSSYQNKNIKLGLNSEMLQYAKDLNAKLELIKTNIEPKIMVNHANDVDSILELVDTNTLNENNIDALLTYIESEQSNRFNYVDCFD
ncbi:hypothetical protein FACS1894166_03010 [Bacilli bacterium]|nr:hypothetical protein FACS1894166_03010 [Bacilli bacterium]